MSTRNSAVKVLLPVGVADLVHAYTAATSAQEALPVGAALLMFQNSGTGRVHFIVGITGVAAAVVATCMFIEPGQTMVFDTSAGLGGALFIRAIGATTTGSIYITKVA